MKILLPYTLLHALILLFISAGAACAQNNTVRYKNGDLVFQDMDCGPMCDAIESVTQSYGNYHFSHIGLVYLQGESVYIIEAIGKEVQLTPLQRFEARSTKALVHARVKPQYATIAARAVDTALTYLGTAYDNDFIYNNGKYYCSEMIYDAFKAANGGKAFFRLEPMTFKQPGSKEYFPVWVEHYRQLGIAIPQGKPGINPGGMSRSSRIYFVR